MTTTIAAVVGQATTTTTTTTMTTSTSRRNVYNFVRADVIEFVYAVKIINNREILKYIY